MRRDASESGGRLIRRYHLHPPGLLYVFVTVFLAIGAINGQNNVLFWAFGVAVSGLLFSGLVSGSMMMGVRIRREPVETVSAGQDLVVRYELENRARVVPAFALTIEEMREGRRKPRLGAGFVAHIAARGRSGGSATIPTERRGAVELGTVRVSSAFPFGLVRKSVSVRAPATALVLPAELRLKSGLLRSVFGSGVIGVGDANRRGEGDEFYGLRAFRDGESMRKVAWRATARSGTLIARDLAAPAPKRIWIVPAISSEAPEQEQENAVAIAASLLRRAAKRGLAAGLYVPGAAIERHPKIGARSLRTTLTDLALLDTSACAGAESLPRSVGGRDAVVVVTAGSEPSAALRGRCAVLDGARVDEYLEQDTDTAPARVGS